MTRYPLEPTEPTPPEDELARRRQLRREQFFDEYRANNLDELDELDDDDIAGDGITFEVPPAGVALVLGIAVGAIALAGWAIIKVVVHFTT